LASEPGLGGAPATGARTNDLGAGGHRGRLSAWSTSAGGPVRAEQGVVVGVNGDEPGGSPPDWQQHRSHGARARRPSPRRHDPPAAHADVGPPERRAGAIDQHPSGKREVKHLSEVSQEWRRPGRPPMPWTWPPPKTSPELLELALPVRSAHPFRPHVGHRVDIRGLRPKRRNGALLFRPVDETGRTGSDGARSDR